MRLIRAGLLLSSLALRIDAASPPLPPAVKNAIRIGLVPSAIGFDAVGNMYLSGGTPDPLATIPGSTILGRGAGGDIFVVKLSPAQDVQYVIEIGGSIASPLGTWLVGMVVDSMGNVYLAGGTGSSDFPTTPGTFEPSSNGGGGFLLKLDPSGHLVFSTYFDQTGTSVAALAVDKNGNAYLAGYTNRKTFPTTKGAYLENNGISAGAHLFELGFVSEIDSNGKTLLSSTLLGPTDGQIEDYINSIALDGSGVVHVCGLSGIGDFPTTPGAPYSAPGNGGFLARLNPSLSTLLYSTLLPLPLSGNSMQVSQTGDSYLSSGARIAKIDQKGTIAYNQPSPGVTAINNLILLDNGAVLLAGSADRPDFPTVDTLQPCEPNLAHDGPIPPGSQRVTVTTFDASGKITFSTLLGGVGQYGFAAVGRDLSGMVYISGWSFGDGAQFPGGPLLIAGRANAFVFQLDLSAIQHGLPAPSCLANGATFAYGPAAPGLIAALYGSNLGPGTGVQFQLDADGRIASELGGTAVTVGGVRAPLLYVRDEQINFIIPFEVTGANTNICVLRAGAQSCIYSFVAPVAPGVFGVSYQRNSAGQAAAAAVFGTGMGPFDRELMDGTVAGPPLANLTNPVQATFTWRSCGVGFFCNPQSESSGSTVLFAGAAPGEVAGVDQIDVKYPDTLMSALSACASTPLPCPISEIQLSLNFGPGATLLVPFR